MNSKRIKNTRVLHSLSAMAGIGLLTVSATAQDPCYRVIDLGVLGFVPTIDHIFGINNSNQAVFTALVAGEKHAMLYLPVGAYNLTAGVHDLHTLAGAAITGDESVAHDINSAGIVVGWAEIGSDRHAFVWRLATTEFLDLETFSTAEWTGDWSEAWAISDDSPVPWIVGKGDFEGNCQCDGQGPQNHGLDRGFALKLIDPAPVLNDAAELRRDPGIDCENNTGALDINNGPQPTAAGFSFFGGGNCITDLNGAPLSWADPPAPDPRDGVALPLLASDIGSQARGVSNLEAFSGFATTSEDEARAAYWEAVGGPIVNLGSLWAAGQTWGWRMNNNAPPGGVIQVVGDTGVVGEGLLWECSDGCDVVGGWSVTDLNDTIGLCSDDWTIRQAHDVNDNGWIIGMASAAPAERHAVILAPLANCPPCVGDIDGNNIVGASDLLALLAAWGPCPAAPALCDEDLDCDGSVGAADLLIILANWGPCGFPIASGPPQDVLDCINRFCCDEEDLVALEKCLCTVDPECTPSP